MATQRLELYCLRRGFNPFSHDAKAQFAGNGYHS